MSDDLETLKAKCAFMGATSRAALDVMLHLSEATDEEIKDCIEDLRLATAHHSDDIKTWKGEQFTLMLGSVPVLAGWEARCNGVVTLTNNEAAADMLRTHTSAVVKPVYTLQSEV